MLRSYNDVGKKNNNQDDPQERTILDYIYLKAITSSPLVACVLIQRASNTDLNVAIVVGGQLNPSKAHTISRAYAALVIRSARRQLSPSRT